MAVTRYPGVQSYETKQGTRYLFKYRDSRGKHSTKRGFTSPQAANKAKGDFQGRSARGELQVAGDTFAEFWPVWLHRKQIRQPDSHAFREVAGRKWLLPEWGRYRLTRISSEAVEDWLLELAEAGTLAPKTLNNYLGVFHGVMAAAAKAHKIPYNPISAVEKLTLDDIERDYLRRHEIPLYLAACSEVYQTLAEVLIGTGCRISEALALRWDDIDVDGQIVRVFRQRKRGKDGATKGRRSRSVEVGPQLMRTLADRRALAAEATGEDIYRAWVFPMPTRVQKHDRGRWQTSWRASEPIDRNTVSRDWHKETLEAAALRDMPLHSLRHTAAAVWLSQGASLAWVQKQLGHRSINTTDDFYGHFDSGTLTGVAAQAEAAILAVA